MTNPEDIAAAIIGHLEAALEEIDAVSDELEDEDDMPIQAADGQEAVA